MGDTTVRECICCGAEDDCIQGLCMMCSEYNYKLQNQRDGLLTACNGFVDAWENQKDDSCDIYFDKIVEAIANANK